MYRIDHGFLPSNSGFPLGVPRAHAIFWSAGFGVACKTSGDGTAPVKIPLESGFHIGYLFIFGAHLAVLSIWGEGIQNDLTNTSKNKEHIEI